MGTVYRQGARNCGLKAPLGRGKNRGPVWSRKTGRSGAVGVVNRARNQ